jgi:hypothetical protein
METALRAAAAAEQRNISRVSHTADSTDAIFRYCQAAERTLADTIQALLPAFCPPDSDSTAPFAAPSADLLSLPEPVARLDRALSHLVTAAVAKCEALTLLRDSLRTERDASEASAVSARADAAHAREEAQRAKQIHERETADLGAQVAELQSLTEREMLTLAEQATNAEHEAAAARVERDQALADCATALQARDTSEAAAERLRDELAHDQAARAQLATDYAAARRQIATLENEVSTIRRRERYAGLSLRDDAAQLRVVETLEKELEARSTRAAELEAEVTRARKAEREARARASDAEKSLKTGSSVPLRHVGGRVAESDDAIALRIIANRTTGPPQPLFSTVSGRTGRSSAAIAAVPAADSQPTGSTAASEGSEGLDPVEGPAMAALASLGLSFEAAD